jgi:hypothetical protein
MGRLYDCIRSVKELPSVSIKGIIRSVASALQHSWIRRDGRILEMEMFDY